MPAIPSRSSSFASSSPSSGRRRDMMINCPESGCSFRALQQKRVEAHYEATHYEVTRQHLPWLFVVVVLGIYSERHHTEPPTARKKPATQKPRPRRSDVPKASTSRHPTPSRDFDDPISSASSSVGDYCFSYSSSPTPSSSGYSSGHSSSSIYPLSSSSSYQSSDLGRQQPRPWGSWCDMGDSGLEAIEIACGNRPFEERNYTTKYLPVPEDHGLVPKHLLWA
ncbi:hypothetical protein C8J57DRAFT_1719265 [Mycena rebaudengoi]|nr:hypothetical protein C8J57DRAFT_1719265 [Mycena rebaudengoi]